MKIGVLLVLTYYFSCSVPVTQIQHKSYYSNRTLLFGTDFWFGQCK